MPSTSNSTLPVPATDVSTNPHNNVELTTDGLDVAMELTELSNSQVDKLFNDIVVQNPPMHDFQDRNATAVSEIGRASCRERV